MRRDRLAHAYAAERAEREAVHRVYLRLLAGLLDPQGQAPEPWLPAIDGDFVDAATLRQWLPKVARACALPRPGLALGARAELSVHGRLGLAMASAATLADALDVMCRYSTLRARALRPLPAFEAGGDLLIRVREDADLGAARGFVLDAWAALVQRALVSLVGRPLEGLLWDPPLPSELACSGEPSPFDRDPARQLSLRVPAGLLRLPCIGADAETHAAMLADCERSMTASGSEPSLAAAVRAELLRCRDGFPDAGGLAARLGLSRRSLFRRLAAEGQRWQALLDEERSRRACQLLECDTRPVASIAAELGFDDASSFGRSFRRWTGRSPRAWRQSPR